MASYQHLLQHTKSRFESPAKVFAKLKSKVQREEKEAVFTDKDPKHAAEFKSPRRRVESTWMSDELKENHRFASYRSEAQPLTLSPISSPQKTVGYSCSDFSFRPEDEVRHGYTPRKSTFLESAAHPLTLSRRQTNIIPPQIRDLDGFLVTSRTPVKIHPAEKDSVSEEDNLMSPSSIFSPMRKRLRKRKWELQEFNKVSSSSTKEVLSQPPERKTSRAFSADDTHNICMEDLGHLRGSSVDQSGQITREPMLPPPTSTAKKRSHVFAEKNAPMSPAKMFAFMKERERKTEQQEVQKVSSSTMDLYDEVHNYQPSHSPPSNTGEMEDIISRRTPERELPVSRSMEESADSQSDTDPSVPIPAAPVLLEDPLVLNTPRVSIPKKNESFFKRNKWSQQKFPSESVIHLRKWFLRKNQNGLFVDGIHQENNIPWNSNIIVDRVSNSVVKTVSGRIYILVGRMNFDIDSGFPKWFLKSFANGFPPNWKALHEKFLSDPRDDSSRQRERKSKAKTKSEASSISLSVKKHRQKPLKTPASCPPPSSACTNVSRSGRVIKPPLEYWRGGRVILDAHMNVTIHECYDTSICNPDVTTSVSSRPSQKPARVFLPCSEGRKKVESATDTDSPAPLRKVKAPPRRRNKAKVNPDEKPPEHPATSSEERPGKATRSSQRSSPAERTLYVDTVLQKQPAKSSAQRTNRQTHDTTKSTARVSRRKQAAAASPESPSEDEQMLHHQSSEDDFRRQKGGKGAQGKRGAKTSNKHVLLSSQSSESSPESGKEVKKNTRVRKNSQATQKKHKQSNRTKTSPPAKPSPKSTQSSKKHKSNNALILQEQEQDEDEWTTAELMKLQEAVVYFPKHMAGYWEKVARMVGTRSAGECHKKHTSQGTSRTPAKKAKKATKEKAPKHSDHPVISARAGTLKRKQQVREFLEAMPREDVDDVFSSEYMQNKRFEMPSMCPSDDHDFMLSDLEPVTPRSACFPEVKTPQCLHITPGMMGSPNRSNDDKYVFQLQKRMKKKQFNVCKQALPAKSFTPTPSVKRTMRRCGNTENDTFVVWEMFPGNDKELPESGEEEEDFYFSESD